VTAKLLIAMCPRGHRWVQCGPDPDKNGASIARWQYRTRVAGRYIYRDMVAALPLNRDGHGFDLLFEMSVTCRCSTRVISIVDVVRAYDNGVRGRVFYSDLAQS
jgi:hypothetical protein